MRNQWFRDALLKHFLSDICNCGVSSFCSVQRAWTFLSTGSGLVLSWFSQSHVYISWFVLLWLLSMWRYRFVISADCCFMHFHCIPAKLLKSKKEAISFAYISDVNYLHAPFWRVDPLHCCGRASWILVLCKYSEMFRENVRWISVRESHFTSHRESLHLPPGVTSPRLEK